MRWENPSFSSPQYISRTLITYRKGCEDVLCDFILFFLRDVEVRQFFFSLENFRCSFFSVYMRWSVDQWLACDAGLSKFRIFILLTFFWRGKKEADVYELRCEGATTKRSRWDQSILRLDDTSSIFKKFFERNSDDQTGIHRAFHRRHAVSYVMLSCRLFPLPSSWFLMMMNGGMVAVESWRPAHQWWWWCPHFCLRFETF